MGGPLPATLADIHMTRIETDVVVPARSIFYKQHIDDINNHPQKITIDKLYED